MLVRRGYQAGDQPRHTLVEALAGGQQHPRDYRDELRDEWPG
jgi:hypothetical protein